MKKILLQTTIPYAKDDWSIGRFSILADVLSAIRDQTGSRLFQITARDRENLASGNDPVLSRIDESDFDELWLIGVDVGGGLGNLDCAAIGRFRQRGGAIFTSRDHQDLGISFAVFCLKKKTSPTRPTTARRCVSMSWPQAPFLSFLTASMPSRTPIDPRPYSHANAR